MMHYRFRGHQSYVLQLSSEIIKSGTLLQTPHFQYFLQNIQISLHRYKGLIPLGCQLHDLQISLSYVDIFDILDFSVGLEMQNSSFSNQTVRMMQICRKFCQPGIAFRCSIPILTVCQLLSFCLPSTQCSLHKVVSMKFPISLPINP